MGDSTEHWRATIGQWSGGRTRNCVTLHHHNERTSTYIGYMQIKFLVLVSLLVIGCVELNPGPNHERSSPTQSAGALPQFRRRPGTDGLHGKMYERNMAALLFARALNRTEEFQLASNVDGAGAFDDLVFRYRLREQDVWKTCFIQLKHKEKGGTIRGSSLTEMSGDFSLLKYFKSYCEIKNKAATDPNLKQCGAFGDFEFVIYTNAKMESKFLLQARDSDTLSILSSGTEYGNYITFDKIQDKDIFEFFEELSVFHEFIKDLNIEIKRIQDLVTNKTILEKLDILKKKVSTDIERIWIDELTKCDFNLFEEFLNKVKIFQNQSNEVSLTGLIENELQKACKASPSVASLIYSKFQEGFSKWWKTDGNVVWLSENSGLWQWVEKEIITEIEDISNPEIQDIVKCDIRFSEQHLCKLSDAIKQNTVLHIVTNSKVRIVQKLKTYQALRYLGYKNSLFIGIKSLLIKSKEINKLWPCEWSDVLVVDCDSDGNVAQTVLDILQKSADCEQSLGMSDDNTAETTLDVLQKCQAKVIILSTRQEDSNFQETLRNISYFEDNCDVSNLDEMSQERILERPVNFQGTKVALSTLVGTDPPDRIKALLDSDVISILLSDEHELSVGRQLCDHPKYYVPRVLQHQVHLMEDILKRRVEGITFAVSGLQADVLKNYLPAGEEISELVYDESERSHTFKIVSDFSKTGLSAELGNMKAYNEAGQNVNPEDVRYIILRNQNPESEFREVKKLCRNVHWIHVEGRSFLWRDTKGNIDIIRRHIDNTKHQEYDMKGVVEHIDRTMLLVGEPGMGKSTFLCYMAHKIKEWNPSVWVLRINLNEHTKELEVIEFEEDCIGKCKTFLWSAAHSAEQDALNVTKQVFLQALDQTGKMVIILDGFDEISPDYNPKVEMLIRAIREETVSKIRISSRYSYRQELEDIVGNFAFTLQPFTPENQIQFLKKYWSEITEIINQENLQYFAKKIHNLCSQNFSNKDGEFTGIPLQTMMLGEAFVKEVTEYCCSEEFKLPEKFNLLSLFEKFTDKKFDIYFEEKNNMDSSKLEAKNGRQYYVQQHMISALIYLFSQNEFKGLLGKINAGKFEQTKLFLREGRAQKFGIITDITDEKPHFIHRCFAEYFAAKWFTDNFKECEEFISNILFKSRYKVTRNILDRMLAEGSEIHDSVLSNVIHDSNENLKKKTDINTLDKGGRTALHLAASYNSRCIQQLVSFRRIDVNIPDAVLKWTPLRYADRTKSWMAMDILLQNGANPDDIVLTRRNVEAQEWGQAAVWECASKGHVRLLDFMLNCGIEVNASVEVPDNLNEKFTLLHRASYCAQVEIVKHIVSRGADINIPDTNKNTAVHFAAESASVDIIKLLLDKEMSVNLTNTNGSTPLHISANFGHLEATRALVERGADRNSTNKDGDTPLMMAAFKSKLEIFRYLTEIGTDINICNAKKNTALHIAAESGSVDIIKLLLDKGMSVNLANTSHSTALYISAKSGRREAMKVLVESGAEINKTNKYGNTPLMAAAYSGDLEIFRYLTQKDADINICNVKKNTAIHWASASGSVDIINLLLDKGMSVNLANTDGTTPLHVSAKCDRLEAMKALVERGAALDNANKYGITPLLMAAYYGKREIFRYLTEIGADINIRDAKNNTALHLASTSGSVDIIKFLLDKGMSVNLTNTDDSTPLHVCAEFGYLEATKTLVEGGADIYNTNKYGITPFMGAARSGKLEIFNYLTEFAVNLKLKQILSSQI